MAQAFRLSKYRVMWVFVFFDLPTNTAKERKAAAKFRKGLVQDGFVMLQYSIYVRHASSRENMQVHHNRVKKIMPESGKIILFSLTDAQFGAMEYYYGTQPTSPPPTPQQLELF